MNMRQALHRFSLLVFGLSILLMGQPVWAGDALFQYSTIDALLAGLYDGDMTLKDLKFKGDFGLGTLNGIDGELVVLEGQAYHVAAGGKANIQIGRASFRERV